ncbi:YARHG domain-containing protein [Pedobacter sp. MC2016-24]|uniref:YARHG domain-containing protein n=1 Tax=Pedobacter sp. MC2016-24 TaxID=2780090 RepID=UPI00187F9DF3|nr:YARHG domain-containing protein [Pedobacter sp. MC2016-24]MBE9599737.1 YARHG domain-containing protein [Pedobacter sp. MC2016-24]
MKKIVLICSIVMLMCACRDKNKSGTNTNPGGQDEIHKDLYGFWVGDFLFEGDYVYEGNERPAKINIVIKKITKNEVIGQSIVGGKKRILIGKVFEEGDKLRFVMDESGSLKTDGRYEFELKGDTLIGVWNGFKKDDQMGKMQYKLLKKAFVYNPNLMLPKTDYIDWSTSRDQTRLDTLDDGKVDTSVMVLFRSASPQIFEINASNTLLKAAQLKNLRKLDLQIIKNTVFARHGYFFKKSSIRDFFDPVEWYIPISNDVGKELTPIEQANIKLLQRYEKYAEDNYDAFGR